MRDVIETAAELQALLAATMLDSRPVYVIDWPRSTLDQQASTV